MKFTGSVDYIFLDRDGTINRKAPEGQYISEWKEFHFLPRAEEAIARLTKLGKHLIVITNQRGVALGRYTGEDVRKLHAQLQQHLAEQGSGIDGFYFCPHDKDQCECRKPKIGLLEQAFRDFPGAQPRNSILIGDSLSDIQTAHAAGMPSIFIEGHPSTRKAGAEEAMALADAVVCSLWDAVEVLISKQRG